MIRKPARWAASGLVLALLVLLALVLLPPTPTLAQAAVTQPAEGQAQEAKQTAEASTSLPPKVRGKSAILINLADGRVLFESDADTRRAIASTTKIMTGILSLETLPLEQVVTASKQADAAGESEIWLTPGEQLTVEQLLYALMVKSANDAAVALAEASAGSVEAYVEKMNTKAQELGLTNTHFANPHGLDSEEHYSSARDLALLAQYAMGNEEFRRIVGLEKVNIPWGGRDYDRVLESRNGLLGEVPFVDGVKTGYTRKAGFCLVGSGTREGLSLVSVILGEATKDELYDDTVALLEYGFSRYRDVTLTEKNVTMAEMPVPFTIDRKLPLITQTALGCKVYLDDEIESAVTLNAPLVLPVAKGQVLGKVSYEVGGQPFSDVPLVAAEAIEAPTLGVKVRYYWARFAGWLGNIV
jgi:D-alanyl-D-alanine carboxypeptidase (penicillin-binding protein 5/6)